MNHYISICVAQKLSIGSQVVTYNREPDSRVFSLFQLKMFSTASAYTRKRADVQTYLCSELCIFGRFQVLHAKFRSFYAIKVFLRIDLVLFFPRQKCVGANMYAYCISVRVLIGIFCAALILIPGVYFKHVMSVQNIKFSFRKYLDLFNRDIFQDILPEKEIFITLFSFTVNQKLSFD